MADARVVIDPTAVLGDVDPRLFGGFIEHMGRAIYGGIYEPGHPTADAAGWRRDVVDLVRRLGVSIVRYPGGNFVSGYDWEDGIGPRAARPTRLDLAWRSIEPNLVGTDDFIDWTRLVGVEPMLAVNLGTHGPEAARNLVEYCNAPVGAQYADRRAANGHPEPHHVPVWCLGNEMDGPWQIGHTTAADYGRLAADAGAAMRLVDPSIQLVACGSSGSTMPTFGSWEETVLDLAWDVTDHLSLHHYVDPAAFETIGAYLASPAELERMIDRVTTIVDAAGERRGSERGIGLSIDEWNVWHFSEHQAREDPTGPFRRAPAIAEDSQDVADALVVGGLLIAMLRHVDRVRIACLAQLVNVIPAIRTVDGGPAWFQTSAWVFADAARTTGGLTLRVDVDGPTYPVDGRGVVEGIDLVAVLDRVTAGVTVLAVNRLERAVALAVTWRGDGALGVADHRALVASDLGATNTVDHPDRVRPVAIRDRMGSDRTPRLVVDLPAQSWNAIELVASPES